MNWLCVTLMVCLPFSHIMEYTNNEEFIEEVRACVVHHNSMYDDYERVPVNLVVAQTIHESEWGRSRFAVEGNNLLGIRTFDPADDQMKPLNNCLLYTSPSP